jgi:hypothetical protein
MSNYTNHLLTFAPDWNDRRLITTHQPADLLAVLELCGIETFLWALRAEPPELSQRLAVAFAREVLPVWESRQAEAWAATHDTDTTAADAASAAADAIAAALAPSYAHVAASAAHASAVAAYADADFYNVIKGGINHE